MNTVTALLEWLTALLLLEYLDILWNFFEKDGARAPRAPLDPPLIQ